ncbi:MAG TPA: rhodanese-like domain-containing protein [Gemmatimonadaceae bacterium]|jgi:rhodanese-related sulfurtransferase|nr:rhodanese-like domain-containing protein [Gemmatimonadaceae bacterium]
MDAVRVISTDELAAALRAAEVDQFWNVLTAEYFGGELIPGSRWVPLDTVGREASAKRLDKSARIIVYCSGVTCPNSRDAATKLATLGFTDVRLFEGGLEAWTASGRGVEILRRASAA